MVLPRSSPNASDERRVGLAGADEPGRPKKRPCRSRGNPRHPQNNGRGLALSRSESACRGHVACPSLPSSRWRCVNSQARGSGSAQGAGGARTTPPRELEAIVCVCATTIPIRELCREIVADGAIRPGNSILASTDDHRRDRACRGIVSGASETRAWLGPSRQARLGQSGSALRLVQTRLG